MKSFQQRDGRVRRLVLDLPEYPAKRQRQEMAAYAAGDDFKSVDEWLDPARPNDTLVVASFRVLALSTGRKHKRGRTRALKDTIGDAVQKAAVIEAVSGVCSDQPLAWAKAVTKALNFERSGGQLTSEEARKRAKKGYRKGGETTKARSAEQRWKRDPELFNACRDLWRSRSFSGDAARLAAINDYVERVGKSGMVIGSTSTARRLFRNVIKRD